MIQFAQSKTDLPPPSDSEQTLVGVGFIVIGLLAAAYTIRYPGRTGPLIAPNVRPVFAVLFGLGFVVVGVVVLLVK